MTHLQETIKHYCAVIEVEIEEGICDMGVLSPKKGVALLKGGGYKVALMAEGKEVVSGFSPINESDGLTDATIEGAYRSLVYALIHKTIAASANVVVKK